MSNQSSQSEPCLETITTHCPQQHIQVDITVLVTGKSRKNVVAGEPQSCTFQHGCTRRVKCLLNARRIEKPRNKQTRKQAIRGENLTDRARSPHPSGWGSSLQNGGNPK